MGLAAEDIRFRDLLEARRKERVMDYLDGKRKAGEVAQFIGLASAGGLSHWVRRHFSRSPREFYRAA